MVGKQEYSLHTVNPIIFLANTLLSNQTVNVSPHVKTPDWHRYISFRPRLNACEYGLKFFSESRL